MKARARQPQ